MTAVALIPARSASTRLPRKVLADVHGKPLIWHVWNRVSQAQAFDAVYVATDSEEVRQVVEGWGGTALMTSAECRSGTERIASLVDTLNADLIVNVQGDEPLVSSRMLSALVEAWQQSPSDLITPVFPIETLGELISPNIVKVARTADGTALYFSRSAIPYIRDLPQERWLERHQFWGHIGVYGYRRDVLAVYASLPVSDLEQVEQLEQLRFLEAGYRFQTVVTDYRPVAVDVAADLEAVRRLLAGT